MRTHKLSRKAAALLLGFGMALAAETSLAFQFDLDKIGSVIGNVQKSSQEIDEKEEIRLGEEMAANLLGAAPLMKDGNAQKYVNQVGRWLALQTERPGLPWHFGVLDTADVNAFAAPGGYVFITRGLLRQMHNEAQLAGVLAHEIAHVLQKHHLHAIQKSAQTGVLADVLSIAAQQEGRNSAALQKLVSAGTELYARGLDKDDEFEADRMGMVIAARAGYDPFALPMVLRTLEKVNPQDSSLALMFKTHPAPADRLRALDLAVQDRLDSYGGLPDLPGRYEKTLGPASSSR